MKRTKLIAMLLHVLVFMSFILPFQKCSNGVCRPKIVCTSSVTEKKDSINSIAETNENYNDLMRFDQKEISILLYDKDGNFTGFGALYWSFSNYFTMFGLVNAFILLLIGLNVLVFRKKDSRKTVFIVDLIGIVFLLFNKGDMWGYWVCISLWAIMVLFDAFLIYKSKQVVSQ